MPDDFAAPVDIKNRLIKTELPFDSAAIAVKSFHAEAARALSSRQLKTLYWTHYANMYHGKIHRATRIFDSQEN